MVKGMEKFRTLFLEKFDENIIQINRSIKQDHFVPVEFDTVIRMFHNIKSDAGMMGFTHIAMLSRLMETLLNRHKSPDISLTGSDLVHLNGLTREVTDYFRQQCDTAITDSDDSEIQRLTDILENALEQDHEQSL